MRELLYSVSAGEDGVTALGFLKRRGYSRRVITALKQAGALTRNGALLRTVDVLREGDNVRVVLSDSGGALPNPDIPARTAYADEDAVVYDKSPFVPVHPSQRHRLDTLANLFSAQYPAQPFRPINRLDRNTSGLCLCARNRLFASLAAQSLEKVYYAAVDGDIACGGRISAPIAREEGSVIKRCVSPEGKSAVTLYEPILRRNGRTLLRVTLETGRTHQIRVHFAHIGFPLCGDDMYGGDCSGIERHALHCGRLSFTGLAGERVEVSSPLPEDIARLFGEPLIKGECT